LVSEEIRAGGLVGKKVRLLSAEHSKEKGLGFFIIFKSS
jgi:hypothetical protein